MNILENNVEKESFLPKKNCEESSKVTITQISLSVEMFWLHRSLLEVICTQLYQ